MSKREYILGVMDLATAKSQYGTGGRAIVCAAGTFKKTALYDPKQDDFPLIANNYIAFDGGTLNFAVDESVLSVDIFGVTPEGYAFQLLDVGANGQPLIRVNSGDAVQKLVFPVHIDDFPAAVATDSGLLEPSGAVFIGAGANINVKAIDATETLNVGTAADPDGFIAAASVATAGLVVGSEGALLKSTADFVNYASLGTAISATLSAGSDTAAALVCLPYVLNA